MRKIFCLLTIIILFQAGCNNDDDDQPIESLIFEIKATSSSDWKYFSFSKNDTIIVTDPMNSNEWDLAFQRYRIKTNGGESGSGMGSAANSYLKGQAGFDALMLVPDTTTFVEDDSIQIAIQQGYAIYVVNPALYNWFSIELAAQGTQIVPTDYVFIVKTADGRYAKVWFKSYYSASDISGYVSFQYKYQPDGSKKLE
jgi:hypothetical protein